MISHPSRLVYYPSRRRRRWKAAWRRALREHGSGGRRHRWLYRGQYSPANKNVEIQCWITGVDEAAQTITADGLLSRDGLCVYEMRDFTLRVREPGSAI